MKATARRGGGGYTHRIEIRDHRLVADEPQEHGGTDAGPTPQELLAASLASCVAITLEMYASRKEWELGEVEVECRFEQPPPGERAHYELDIGLSAELAGEQHDRLLAIASKCPVHRLLEGGGARFTQRIVQSDPATS